jgi:hypothetical protein
MGGSCFVGAVAMYSRAVEKPRDIVVGVMKLVRFMVYVDDILVTVVAVENCS